MEDFEVVVVESLHEIDEKMKILKERKIVGIADMLIKPSLKKG